MEPAADLSKLKCRIKLVLGETERTLAEVLALKEGAVVVVEKLAGELLDLEINGQVFFKGEAVVVDGRFGIRLTKHIPREVETNV